MDTPFNPDNSKNYVWALLYTRVDESSIKLNDSKVYRAPNTTSATALEDSKTKKNNFPITYYYSNPNDTYRTTIGHENAVRVVFQYRTKLGL